MISLFQTNSTGGFFYGSFGLEIIPIVVLICIFSVILTLLTQLTMMRRISKAFHFLGKTFIYFIKGGLVLVAIGTPSYFLYYATSEGIINWIQLFTWIGIGIAGFFSIAGFGYCMDKIFKRIKQNWHVAKEVEIKQ